MPETPRSYNAERRFIRARNAWLWRVSPGRYSRIHGVMIHCTRGGRSAGDDGPGTENWGSNPGNQAAYWDMLAYEVGQQVQSTHYEQDEEPLWCAGYGAAGTWSAQDYYLQFELAQGNLGDPFPAEQIESAAQWVGQICRMTGNWPIQRIPFLYQVGAPPFGICTHEDSANGRKLGKSDPGYNFPWETFLARARYWADQGPAETPEEDALSAADVARIDRLERVMGGWGITVRSTPGNLAVMRDVTATPDLAVGLDVAMTGEVAISFLDKMGMSIYGGLAISQMAAVAALEIAQAISPVGGGLSDDAIADILIRVADKMKQNGVESLGLTAPTLILPPAPRVPEGTFPGGPNE